MSLSDTLLIRPVEQEDFAKWKPLWDGYNAFYGRQGETALPDSITNMTWSRFFDGYEPRRIAAWPGTLSLSSQHNLAWANLLFAGLVHGRVIPGKGNRTRTHRRGLSMRETRWLQQGVLEHAQDKHSGDQAVRQGGGRVGFSTVSKDAVRFV
jgi:hypothetical protein